MIGRTIADYRILSRLGAGGMGEVFLADDIRLGRQVAFKILPPEVAGHPDRLRRFEQEARAAASLNHPNIVTVYGTGAADGVHFLTMELVEGRTLADSIVPGGLSIDEALAVAIPLADALAAVHERRLTHRDLKPRNVMITGDGRVKVLDFGLAKLREEVAEEETRSRQTTAGRLLGTPAYMSPEQVQGRPADARSDIFAFGAVLYEMVTGRLPFDGASPADMLSAILRDAPRPVTVVNPAVPANLERVIRRCLEKDPRRRYQSAVDLRNDLEEAANAWRAGRTPAAAAVPARAPSWWRRNRRPAVAAALVAAVALAAGAYLGYFESRRAAPAGRPIRSLAVLPFDNMMHDPAQDYFVEGMQDTLITALAGISTLKVISRTSAMHYKGVERPLPEIARELGVDGLIEGSVLKVGDKVRVTAQLIDGATDQHVWANSYDRDVRNVLALMSDVAGAIAGEVALALTPEEQRRLHRARPVDPLAQEAYLRGRHALYQFTAAGCREAVVEGERAVAIDPSFADAYALVAGGHLLSTVVALTPMVDAAPKARAAARRALALDNQNGQAMSLLGFLELYMDWDWAAARTDLERALELAPNDAITRHGYADYLLISGRLEESIAQVDLARQYDPLSPLAVLPAVAHRYFARRYGDVIVEGRRLLAAVPEAKGVHAYIGHALWQTGRYDEAIAEYRLATPGHSAWADTLARGYAQGGARAASRALAEHLEARARSEWVDPIDVAATYAEAGEADAALSWIERALADRRPGVLHMKFLPDFDPIRNDPRFDALLKRIGMPE